MISTAEEVLENVRSLPNFEREKFFKLVESEKNNSLKHGDKLNLKDEKFKLSLKWIDEHRQEFDGQWVALDGERLLAHGTDGKKVHAQAQAKGVKTPLIHRVSVNETMPFGGW
jgi:Family of unknown function (DUF5678)